MDPDAVKRAWEALGSCSEEFDGVRHMSPSHGYATADEMMRFADGWRIFIFEAHVVIEKALRERLEKLDPSGTASAFIVEPQTESALEARNVRHLLDIARSKCETESWQAVETVRRHVNTRWAQRPS